MANQAGWYPVNEQRELGYWDGTGWTGDRIPNPAAPQRNISGVLGSVAAALFLVAAVLMWAGVDLLLQALGG